MKKIVSTFLLSFIFLGLVSNTANAQESKNRYEKLNFKKNTKSQKKKKNHNKKSRLKKRKFIHHKNSNYSNSYKSEYNKNEGNIDNLVHTYTYFKDKNAEFESGLDGFLKFYKENTITQNTFQNEVETIVTFVIDQSGHVSHVSAVGENSDVNQATINTILKSNGKWKPAEINGYPVKAIHTIPIKAKFVKTNN